MLAEIIIPNWSLYLVPFFLTICCLVIMLRPERQTSNFGIGAIFRLLWFIRIAIIWFVTSIVQMVLT